MTARTQVDPSERYGLPDAFRAVASKPDLKSLLLRPKTIEVSLAFMNLSCNCLAQATYMYWLKKRKKRGKPLIRAFQVQSVRFTCLQLSSA